MIIFRTFSVHARKMGDFRLFREEVTVSQHPIE